MFEATVSVENTNAHLLEFVKRQLEPSVLQVDGLTGQTEGKFRDYYSVACDDAFRFQIRRQLVEAILQALSLGYKNVFVRQLLGTDQTDFFQNVLVNTICIFDNDCDKQAVRRVLGEDNVFCLDGYYNFRMDPVKQKWQEITKLVSDNFYVMTDSRLITEFLQYLLESAPCKVKQLSVSVDDGFVLYGTNNKVVEPVFSLAKQSTAEEEILLNVLWFKPQKVKIYHSRPLGNDFRKLICSLFDTEFVLVE